MRLRLPRICKIASADACELRTLLLDIREKESFQCLRCLRLHLGLRFASAPGSAASASQCDFPKSRLTALAAGKVQISFVEYHEANPHRAIEEFACDGRDRVGGRLEDVFRVPPLPLVGMCALTKHTYFLVAVVPHVIQARRNY